MKNDKIKLMIFLPNLHGGGAEKVAVNIMRALDSTRYEIHLVLVSKVGEYIDLIPSYVIMHDLNVKKTFLSLFKLRKRILEVEPDIIYSSLIRANIITYLARCLIFGRQPIMILRSPNSPKLLIKNKQLGTVTQFFLEKAYKKANLVLAQTPEMKIELEHYYKLMQTKVEVLINPVDGKLINSKVLNTTNPFNDNYINVVAAGRLTYQKGFDTLVKAFKNVVKVNQKFRLYIIGSNHGEEESLLKLIENLQLKEYIFLLGFQENPYVFYHYSDLFVLSSRWEGLPNAVLENLFLNKPVVATRCIPFMEDLITNDENGILVEVDDISGLSQAILNYQKIKLKRKRQQNDVNSNLALNQIFNPLKYNQ